MWELEKGVQHVDSRTKRPRGFLEPADKKSEKAEGVDGQIWWAALGAAPMGHWSPDFAFCELYSYLGQLTYQLEKKCLRSSGRLVAGAGEWYWSGILNPDLAYAAGTVF